MSSNNSTPLTDNAELPPIAEAKNTYQIEPAVDIQLVPFEKFYSSAETKEKPEQVEPLPYLNDRTDDLPVVIRRMNMFLNVVNDLQRAIDAIRKERAG